MSRIELTNNAPGVGRILHFYTPWTGHEPQPCITNSASSNGVTSDTSGGEEVAGPCVDVAVFVNRSKFPEFIGHLHERPDGNTFTVVPVYNKLTPEQREILKTRTGPAGPGTWCEWPQ